MVSKKRRASPPFDSRSVIQYGAKTGDVLLTKDGTEIRVVSGCIKGSRAGCESWEIEMIPDVCTSLGYDTYERCAALGQSCACSRGDYWNKCTHEASAKLDFLSVGDKIRDTCHKCGTDPSVLLQKGAWHWRDALKHIRGESTDKPSLQLRRSLFAHRNCKPKIMISTDSMEPEICQNTVRVAQPSSVLNYSPIYANRETWSWYQISPHLNVLAHFVEKFEDPVQIAKSICPNVTYELYEKISQMTASQLKSLMQKIVRWGRTVACETESMDSILVCCFIALINGPGQYLPDLKVNMKGPRLAFQRLVTILIEDGISAHDYSEELYYYATVASITQDNGLRPDAEIVKGGAMMLIRGSQSDSVLAWRKSKMKNAGLVSKQKTTHSIAARICSIFTQLGAMPNDLQMFSAIEDSHMQSVLPPETHRPAIQVCLLKLLSMHLDQHSEAGFGHTTSLDWWHTTGANYREGRPLNCQKLLQMEEAQIVAFAHTNPYLLHRPEVESVGISTIRLETHWEELVAYSAGEIYIHANNRPYIAVFAPHDIQSISIMEKPSRAHDDVHYISIDSEEYNDVIKVVRMKKIYLQSPLEGYVLYFDDEWKIKQVSVLNGNANLLDGKFQVPLHESGYKQHMSLLCVGKGIREFGLDITLTYFRRSSERERTEIVRTLSVINAAKEIHMRPLERSTNPKGLYSVYRFLTQIAFQIPGALTLTRASVFKVNNPILFTYVRDILINAANQHYSPQGQFFAAVQHYFFTITNTSIWKPPIISRIADFLPCENSSKSSGMNMTTFGNLRPSQTQCIDGLVQSGCRSFVLAPTGSGKTAVAVNRICSVANDIHYAFFFIDTLIGVTAIASEIEARCQISIVFLDPRKSNKPGAKKIRSGKITNEYHNHTAMPVKNALNIVIYDHFASSEDFRSSIIDKASQSFAVYDEVDKLYAYSKRSLFAVPFARLFKYLVMMSATALRKHTEEIGPRAAIASLFAPIPITNRNLLVFFAGSVQTFAHSLAYEKDYITEYFTISDKDLQPRGFNFHSLSESTFEASIPKLFEVAQRHPPCICVCETSNQVDKFIQKYPKECQRFPDGEEDVHRPIVVITKYQGRSTNFGKKCMSMVHVPLASSVATRRQIEGRLTRGPLRKLTYTVVILENSVLDFLAQQQRASNAMQIKLENLVSLANAIKYQKLERDRT